MNWCNSISNGHMADSKPEPINETCNEHNEEQVIDNSDPHYKIFKLCSNRID